MGRKSRQKQARYQQTDFDEEEKRLLLAAKLLGIDVLALYDLVDELEWVYGGDEPIQLVNPSEQPTTLDELTEFDRNICAAGLKSFVRRRFDFEEFMKAPDSPAEVGLPDFVLVEEITPGLRTRRPFEVFVKTIDVH